MLELTQLAHSSYFNVFLAPYYCVCCGFWETRFTMRSILVVNPKGGCGKTTIATNLAGFYVNKGLSVALIDMDQQMSSYQWAASRNENLPNISSFKSDVDVQAQRLIYDCPAQIHIGLATDLIDKSDVMIMPINPSIIDQRAAFQFIMDVRGMMRANVCKRIQIGFVANRANNSFRSFGELEKFSSMMNVPIVTALRNSQNYVSAANAGKSIFDLPRTQVAKDIEQWKGLCYWAEGKLLKKRVQAQETAAVQ